jgi:hypothetical protein
MNKDALKYYKRLNYLRRVKKEMSTFDEDLIETNPYLKIHYGRKEIILMPDENIERITSIIDRWFEIKAVSYNYMHDILSKNFTDNYKNIPVNYYRIVFNDIINKLILGHKDDVVNIPKTLVEAILDMRIPKDIILYAFSCVQTLVREKGPLATKLCCDNCNTLFLSMKRIKVHTPNLVWIDSLEVVPTTTAKKSAYSGKSIVKIYKNDFDQYCMRLGYREKEDIIEFSEFLGYCEDGTPVFREPIIEL